MEQNYFEGYETPETIKRRYFELSKELHPDKGGDANLFAEMNRQYQIALQSLGQKARREQNAALSQAYARLLADGVSLFTPKIAKFMQDERSVKAVSQCGSALRQLSASESEANETSDLFKEIGNVCDFISSIQRSIKH